MAGSGRLATIRMAMVATLAAHEVRGRGVGVGPGPATSVISQTSSRDPVGRRDLDAVGARRTRSAPPGSDPNRCRPAPTGRVNAPPAARRATTSTVWSGCSRRKAMVSASTWAQRSPPRRRAACVAPQPRQVGVRRERLRVPLLAAVPRHRAAGVLAVDALEPDLVAGEDHRDAGHRELQPGGDAVDGGVPADEGADAGGVVGAEDVPARRGGAPAERALPGPERLDDRAARRDAGPAPVGRTGAPARPGRAATTTPATRSRSSSSCRASRRRRRRRWRRGCARR